MLQKALKIIGKKYDVTRIWVNEKYNCETKETDFELIFFYGKDMDCQVIYGYQFSNENNEKAILNKLKNFINNGN